MEQNIQIQSNWIIPNFFLWDQNLSIFNPLVRMSASWDSLWRTLWASVAFSASSATPLVTISRVSWRSNKDYICLCQLSQFLPSRIGSQLGIPLPLFITATRCEIYPEFVTQMHKNQKARDTNLLVQDHILHTLMREKERVQNVLNCYENREDEESFCGEL